MNQEPQPNEMKPKSGPNPSNRNPSKKNAKRRGKTRRRTARARELDVSEVFARELVSIQQAEQELGRFLPRLDLAPESQDLQELVSDIAECSNSYQRSLEKVIAQHQTSRRGSNEAMRALIREAEKARKTAGSTPEGQLLAITSLQKMMHYAIASYGSLCAWSELVGDEDAVNLFRRLTAEKKHYDGYLTDAAEEILMRRSSMRDGFVHRRRSA